MHIDVSRACFHAKAQRSELVRLPVEDRSNNRAGNIGLWNESRYGTRDAASNWERDWQKASRTVSGGTNLDQFQRRRLSGQEPTFKLIEVKNQLAGVCPVKTQINSHGSAQSINRRVRWGKRVVVHQHDPRHLARWCEHVADDDAASERSEALEPGQLSRHRPHVARCLFLSEDRAGGHGGLLSTNVKPVNVYES